MIKKILVPGDILVIETFRTLEGGPTLIRMKIYRGNEIFDLVPHKVPAYELPMVTSNGSDGFELYRVKHLVSLVVWSSGLRWKYVKKNKRGFGVHCFHISFPRNKKVKVAE